MLLKNNYLERKIMQKEIFLFHIPHSSLYIPEYKGYLVSKEEIKKEINYLTDWETENIFNVADVTQLVVPFSRVFCDVERFYDDQEPMFKKGAGIAYTKMDSGEELRVVDDKLKTKILNNFYHPHHKKLDDLASEKLDKFGEVIIVDCHSFSSTPLNREFKKDAPRPDICIGSDVFHTNKNLEDLFVKFFLKNGFSVEVNLPYEGTMVPNKFYQKDDRVQSIMIEINKKLYMNEENFEVDKTAVKKLNKLINELVSL